MQVDFARQQQWDDQVFGQLQLARKDLQQVLAWDVKMFQVKARVSWMEDGDRNMSFFHASIRERLQRDKMKLKLQDGSWCTNNKKIGEMAVDYFKGCFTSQAHVINEELFQDFSISINVEDNEILEKVPDLQEVWNAIKNFNPNSSPEVDGFTGQFY